MVLNKKETLGQSGREEKRNVKGREKLQQDM